MGEPPRQAWSGVGVDQVSIAAPALVRQQVEPEPSSGQVLRIGSEQPGTAARRARRCCGRPLPCRPRGRGTRAPRVTPTTRRIPWPPRPRRGDHRSLLLGVLPADEAARGEPARHLADAAAAGHVEYEGWRVRKDGTRFWADVVLTALFHDTGALRGYGKVTHDATDRLSAKQALRESEEHFALMVASVRDYAILMLGPAGRVVSWNAGAERIKGYSADQIVGRSFAVFYPPEEVERGEPSRHLAEAASTGHVEYEGGGCARTGRASGPTWS